MTNEQESRLSMYLAVALFCEANARATSNLPNFTANLAILKSTSTQIQSISEQQKIDKTGVTESKNQLKSALIVMAADNARKITAFAKFTNNLTLLAEVGFTESDFRRCSDTGLKDYTQIIHDRVAANLAALESYNITADTQSAFLNAINSYNAALSTPRVGVTQKSQATKQLVAHFEAGNEALANMDTAVEIIRLSQVNFYNGYKTARKLIETGGGSLIVKGFVTDSMTGEPLKGAIINFCPECVEPTAKTAANGIKASKEEVVLTKKTAQKGGFNIKSLPEGVYKVAIKKNGYKDQVVTVAITNGELSDLNIELSKN